MLQTCFFKLKNPVDAELEYAFCVAASKLMRVNPVCIVYCKFIPSRITLLLYIVLTCLKSVFK